MIYGNVIKQYERNINSSINSIDESSYILESLYKERDNYNSLLEYCIDDNEREILEAKYEVINEAVGAAIIAAIIAVIGIVIVLLVKVCSMMKKGSDKVVEVSNKIKDAAKNKEKVDINDTPLSQYTNNKTDEPNKDKDDTGSNNNTNKTNIKLVRKLEDDKTTYKASNTIIERVKKNDIRGLQYVFIDCLDVDPTFDKYKADWDYCQKNIPEMFEPHKEMTPFSNNPEDYTDDYWITIKSDLEKNFSVKRFEHMKEVAKTVYAEKIVRLKKERGEKVDDSSDSTTKATTPPKDQTKKTEEPKTINQDDLDLFAKDTYNKLKDLFDKFSNNIGNGSLGNFSKYKCVSEYVNNITDENGKYNGLSSFDYTTVLRDNAISGFTKMVRLASTDREIPEDLDDMEKTFNVRSTNGEKTFGHKDNKVSNSSSLSRQVTNGDKADVSYNVFTPEFIRNIDDSSDGDFESILVSHFNKNASKDTDKVIEAMNDYLFGDVKKNAFNTKRKYENELKILKSELERLKKVNYNVNDIKSEDDNETASRRQTFMNNMLKVEKNALTAFSNFLKSWNNLEIYRINFCAKLGSSNLYYKILMEDFDNYFKSLDKSVWEKIGLEEDKYRQMNINTLKTFFQKKFKSYKGDD